MSKKRAKTKVIQCYSGTAHTASEDQLACEEPLQITLDGQPIAVVMRTPGDDLDLVRGFLLSEGIIASLCAVSRIDVEQKKNHALVFTKDDVVIDYARLKRNLYSASSCGICGKASIDSIRQEHPKIEDGLSLSRGQLLGLPEKLRDAQDVFENTGGLHGVALFAPGAELLIVREDVGRHNAIDKVLGAASQSGLDTRECGLLVSGRVSFEVMQKAHALGVPMVVAISAPTSLAVEFAEDSGQTLVGFLRPPKFNCYAGPERFVD